MHNLNKYHLLIITLVLNNIISAQITRFSDINNVGWCGNHFVFKLNKKVDLVADYQIRRDNWIKNDLLQQGRAGIQYNFSPKQSATIGYSFIETYPYGDLNYPISPSGYKYPEHRIYEQVVLKDQIGRFELTHRYRHELRWVAKQDAAHMHEILEWRRSNRFRYLLRVQAALQGPTIEPKEFYFVWQNEILINFGSKVKYNVFDQYRSAPMFGYKFSPKFKIEFGAIVQIAQLGAYPSGSVGKSVFQYNMGYNINTFFNFDCTKKDKVIPVK